MPEEKKEAGGKVNRKGDKVDTNAGLSESQKAHLDKMAKADE